MDVHIWLFIYDCTYMNIYIYIRIFIYEQSYMNNHIWTIIYDRLHMNNNLRSGENEPSPMTSTISWVGASRLERWSCTVRDLTLQTLFRGGSPHDSLTASITFANVRVLSTQSTAELEVSKSLPFLTRLIVFLTLNHTTPHHTTSHHTTSHPTSPHPTTPHTTSYHITLHRTTTCILYHCMLT